MIENLEAVAFLDPFPHLIFNNFYNKNELELIWEELNYYTKPGKFLQPKNYGGIETLSLIHISEPTRPERIG